MNKQIYEDYKYCMQDVGTIYLGVKYTFDEILENEDINFKLRLVMERYILPESDREDTLETHLYYLDEKSFINKIYRQLKAKVKICVLQEKKLSNGTVKKEYVTKVLPVSELSKISPADKEVMGVAIQELSVSKLALLAF